MPENINALYPQPPTNSLANMGLPQLVETANALTGLEARQRELAAQKALGSAYTSAPLAPSGAPDPAAAWNAFKGSPGAAYGPVAMEAARVAQEQSRAQSELLMKQRDYVQARIAPLAFKKDLQPEEVISAIVDHGNALGLPSALIQAQVAGVVGKRGKALNDHLGNILSMTQGPVTAATRVETAPEEGTLAPQKGPLGGYNYSQSPGAAPGVGTTGAPLGSETTASRAAEESVRMATGWALENERSPMIRAMLGNLEEDLKHFTAGPGADWTRVAKAAINRNIPLPASLKFDPQSIASQEAFNKQTRQLAQQQFEAIGGTGTDTKFNSAYETSPNEALSQLGNAGIIRLLKGNEDAKMAKNAAWQEWLRGNPAKGIPPHKMDSAREFSAEFNKHFDPRAFQFKYIPAKERQEYIDRMEPKDRDRFLQNLSHAHDQGWVNF